MFSGKYQRPVVVVSRVELQTTEQNIDHPYCLQLPVFTEPNVCHARERTKQIVRLDVVPKHASRDTTRDQRLDGYVEAVRGFAIDGFRTANEGVHCRGHAVFRVEKFHKQHQPLAERRHRLSLGYELIGRLDQRGDFLLVHR